MQLILRKEWIEYTCPQIGDKVVSLKVFMLYDINLKHTFRNLNISVSYFRHLWLCVNIVLDLLIEFIESQTH
jgi:hypothetical protein